ncbi:unnamed protein product [Mucor fragilis]
MRIKTKQIDSFTPGETNINAAASLQRPQGPRGAKNQTASDKEKYMGALKRQFRFRLKSEINKCHQDKKKDFGGLLKRLVAAKRLPKDVVADADCLKDADFSSEYAQLFQLPHLELIYSSYFGAVGVQESSLKAFPLHNEILQVLPADDHNPLESLSSHAMKMARQLYGTNFQNMWVDNTIVNKLLTRLLRFLLMCHLCPDQDRDFKAKKKDLQSKQKGKGKQVFRDTNASIPEESVSLINKTRNGRRRLFRKEQQRKQKYERKGNPRAAERCQVRLDTYQEVLERERQERDQRRKTEQQQQPVESDDVDEQLVQDDIKVEKS